MKNILLLNDDMSIEPIYSNGTFNDDMTRARLETLVYCPQNNNFILVEYNNIYSEYNTKILSQLDYFLNFMSFCSEPVYHHIINFIYKYKNCVMKAEYLDGIFKTRIIDKSFCVDTMRLRDIHDYFEYTGINFDKIADHVEIHYGEIKRIRLEE